MRGVSQKNITERSEGKNCLRKFTSMWHILYVSKNNLKPINPSETVVLQTKYCFLKN